MITNIFQVKKSGRILIPFEELIRKIGNKSVFDVNELRVKYKSDYNVIVYEMLYYAFFGAVIMSTMHGLIVIISGQKMEAIRQILS